MSVARRGTQQSEGPELPLLMSTNVLSLPALCPESARDQLNGEGIVPLEGNMAVERGSALHMLFRSSGSCFSLMSSTLTVIPCTYGEIHVRGRALPSRRATTSCYRGPSAYRHILFYSPLSRPLRPLLFPLRLAESSTRLVALLLPFPLLPFPAATWVEYKRQNVGKYMVNIHPSTDVEHGRIHYRSKA